MNLLPSWLMDKVNHKPSKSPKHCHKPDTIVISTLGVYGLNLRSDAHSKEQNSELLNFKP